MKQRVKLIAVVLILMAGIQQSTWAQPLRYKTSSEILHQLKKLNVLGSVLYIAAHPDDENTRLIAYLSGERLVRTAYLSLTRGDGGQNLIGGELGVPLGLIRTEELLAARRIDGADQFFTRAFDFGYSKNAEETFAIWDKEKILGDVVRIIRSFKPDIIITRFPGDERAGHGHHTGSALLALEGFHAAADSSRFPEQIRQGLEPWAARRLLWNTFSFGGNSTIREDQFKFDAGAYNPLLGMSYGEISALSRSEHKSQGFGVPSSRGEALEYFETVAGPVPVQDIMEGIDLTWGREGIGSLTQTIDKIITDFDPSAPQNSVPELLKLYKLLGGNSSVSAKEFSLQDRYSSWKKIKAAEVAEIIKSAMGIFAEITATQQVQVAGDSLKLRFTMINRSGIPIDRASLLYQGKAYPVNDMLRSNINYSIDLVEPAAARAEDYQPYWLRRPSQKGSFDVVDEELIGLPGNPDTSAILELVIQGNRLEIAIPRQYKYTDPVNGEIRQPLLLVPPLVLTVRPQVLLAQKKDAQVQVELESFGKKGEQRGHFVFEIDGEKKRIFFQQEMEIGGRYGFSFPLSQVFRDKNNKNIKVTVELEDGNKVENFGSRLHLIQYDHIPVLHYFQQASFQLIGEEIKTTPSKLAYIRGAGDLVPEALQALGYELVVLEEKDITQTNLQQFDAVITGIRAYNVQEFLSRRYDILMKYVENGGNLIVQYNTNSMIGPVRAKISPHPFTISRNRVTDEESKVRFSLPKHKVLNFPNKISAVDFNGWVQERGLYFAEKPSAAFEAPLIMQDAGYQEDSGSLIIADYGKGKFVYTGLSFFRQLPAGVPGAYKLIANIIALNR